MDNVKISKEIFCELHNYFCVDKHIEYRDPDYQKDHERKMKRKEAIIEKYLVEKLEKIIRNEEYKARYIKNN